MQASEPQLYAAPEDITQDESIEIDQKDRGIEFPVESLPYCLQGTTLSELRSGYILIKNGTLSVDGRNTVPDYLRAKLYAIGSFMFLPGMALAYFLIEQVSWLPVSFTLKPDDIFAYTLKDGTNVVSIVYNRSGNEMDSARRSITFQLEPKHYKRVVPELEKLLPGKRVYERLMPAIPAGSSIAVMGTIIWIAIIVGTTLWHPW